MIPRDQEDGATVSGWAAESCGADAWLTATAAGCVQRFLRRHGCSLLVDPAPGWTALLRVGRAAAAIRSWGGVRSTELFHISDLDAFEECSAERAWVMDATSWDDKAAFFAPAAPPRRTREEPPSLDWNGTALLRTLPDQVRQIEYLLNAQLDRKPCAAVLLAPPAPGLASAHRRLLPGPAASLAAALRTIQGPAAERALGGFRSMLDGARLDALGKAAANSVRAYNWLCGQDRSGCDIEAARRRTQAATAYPVAWALLAAPVGPVAEAVEQSSPLIPVLARALGVAEGTVKRMNGLSASAAGMEAPDAAAAAVAAANVSHMPQGAPPRDEAGWKCYFAAVKLAHAARVALGYPEGSQAALLATCAGRWHEIDADSVRQAAGGIADFAADIHANLLQPSARLSGDMAWTASRSAEAAFKSRPLPQLAEASKWWHSNQADVRARLGGLYPRAGAKGRLPGTWDSLHGGGPWTAPNGLLLVPLCSAAELRDEHERMGHCVDTYADACLLSGSHILSVRRAGAYRPLGTVEISQERMLKLAGTLSEPPDVPLRQLPAAAIQFQAAGNDVPSLEAWEALWSYVGAIMTGAIAVEAVKLEDELAARRELAGYTVDRGMQASYEASTPAAIMEAWRLYAPALPRALAKRGPSALWPAIARPPERGH